MKFYRFTQGVAIVLAMLLAYALFLMNLGAFTGGGVMQ